MSTTTVAEGPPPATVGARVGAALIDFIPAIGLFLLVAATLGTWETGSGHTRIEVRNGAAFLFVGLVLAYHFVFELVYGSTLGKMLVGLVVVDVSGGRPTTGQVFVRNLVRIVDFAPFLYLVGFVAAVANPRNARLGDLAAKTAVVSKRYRGVQPPPVRA